MSESQIPENAGRDLSNASFEQFLASVGLSLYVRRGPQVEPFGNWIIQYANADLAVLNVKVASEGGWTLTFADRAARPEAWYNIGTIRKLLVRDADARFPFTEWFVFASANWNAITALFAPEQREESHRRLGPLEEETIRRRQLAREQQAAQLEELARHVRQRPTQ